MLLGRFDMHGLLVPQFSSHVSPRLPCLAVRHGIRCFLSMMTRRKRNKNEGTKKEGNSNRGKKIIYFHFLLQDIQELWTRETVSTRAWS